MFSLEFQRLRAHLPMQGTWVQSLVQGDPTCPKAIKPHVQTTEPTQPRACVSQQEEPPQWEAWALQLESGPCSPPSLEKALSQQWRPSTANELKKKVKQNRKYQGAPQVLWETFHAVCVCVCVWVHVCMHWVLVSNTLLTMDHSQVALKPQLYQMQGGMHIPSSYVVSWGAAAASEGS